MTGLRTGGRVLVDNLVAQGCDRIFHVPGESFLAVLDALHDTPHIDLVTCRQEGGAAFMACADGVLTGKPGVCFATRGPGATNASIGVHVAMQDSIPMMLRSSRRQPPSPRSGIADQAAARRSARAAFTASVAQRSHRPTARANARTKPLM